MKNVKESCKNVAWIVLVLGIIGSIYSAYTFGITVHGTYYTYVDRDWWLTLAIFAAGSLFSYAFSALFFALFEIIDKMDKLLAQDKNTTESDETDQNSKDISASSNTEAATPSKPVDNQNRFIYLLMILLTGAIVIAFFQNVVL